VNENFDWDAEELTLYEIGLVPDFTLDLEAKTISLNMLLLLMIN
jgi:hypothetical protein